ncbi:hypothetical protein D9M70_634830 [compost metagenome]
MPRMAVELFGVQPQRIGVPQQLFKLQVRLFHLAGPGQAFDIPERTRSEGAFGAGEAVDLTVFVAVAIDHAVAYQGFLDGFEGR